MSHANAQPFVEKVLKPVKVVSSYPVTHKNLSQKSVTEKTTTVTVKSMMVFQTKRVVENVVRAHKAVKMDNGTLAMSPNPPQRPVTEKTTTVTVKQMMG